MKHGDKFFSDLKEWSERKLNIITKYTDGFARILGSRNPILFYVDGFAGQGIYDDGETGSPVRIAEFSENLRKKSSSYSLYTKNVEKDPRIFCDLCNATRRFGKYVENLEGSFNKNCDGILAKIKGFPAIFFLDPFGVKGIEWETISKVISRKEQTDIWLRFDHKAILRLCGFYDSNSNSASGKVNILQSMFGIEDTNYLRARLKCGATPEDRLENAINLYIERLEQTLAISGKDGYAAAYPIISIDGIKKYHLIFACKHPKAVTLASDIVNSIEESFEREKAEYQEVQSGQLNLFPRDITAQQIFNAKVDELKSMIMEIPKNSPISRQKIHCHILNQNKKLFGKFRGTHLTNAINELLAESPKRILCKGVASNNESIITILE